jgi:hypothetical protein
MVGTAARERVQQPETDFVGQGVQILWPVQCQDGDAAFNNFNKVGHKRFSTTSFWPARNLGVPGASIRRPWRRGKSIGEIAASLRFSQ